MKNFQKFENQISKSDKDSEDNLPTNKKAYSIIPDLMTGWKPKNTKIPSPILIKYKSPLAKQLIQYYEDEPHKIIYLGPRYTNSLKFHEHISHQYILKFGIKIEDVSSYIKKQLQTEEQEIDKIRHFQGMNPNITSSFNFNSEFQSGNLDLVIKKDENQYNVLLRPDTNTCGHMQWFYFTIKNLHKGKIKLNICNNRKAKTLYSRGMKPYVLSKKLKESKNVIWHQAGQNLTYQRLHLKQQTEEKNTNDVVKKVHNYDNNYCLSFEYTFEFENDEVSFAYSPPYTFSHLKNVISQLKKNYNCFQTILTQQKFCTSLSGIDIPMLTITDKSIENENKICLISIGRLHPGQSNGSYVMQGFLNFILSAQAQQMRKHVVFKIIPMINPDGVIFGNFRTSLSGKDLNRQFKNKNQDLIPQVTELKNLVKKLKYEQKYKVSYFLDFHGHSLKKNVFFYGPQYDIWSVKYDKAKILPKILATKTDMFRMKSCLFKVASFKKSTARAFMLTLIPYCYTIQSSIGVYRNFKNEDQPFNIKKWKQVGHKVGESYTEMVIKIVENYRNVLKRKQKKTLKQITINEKQITINDQSCKQSNDIQSVVSISKDRQSSTPSLNSSKKYLSPIRNLKKKTLQLKQEMVKIEQQECQSDKFSEGNSDCQSDDNDLPKAQYERLRQKIVNLIDNFEILMIGKKKQTVRITKKQSKIFKIKKLRDISSKKSPDQMLLVPSLKHKITKMGLSQKKINVLSSMSHLDTLPSQFRSPRYND